MQKLRFVSGSNSNFTLRQRYLYSGFCVAHHAHQVSCLCKLTSAPFQFQPSFMFAFYERIHRLVSPPVCSFRFGASEPSDRASRCFGAVRMHECSEDQFSEAKAAFHRLWRYQYPATWSGAMYYTAASKTVPAAAVEQLYPIRI